MCNILTKIFMSCKSDCFYHVPSKYQNYIFKFENNENIIKNGKYYS